jgi:hypothetical protein
LAKKPPKLKVKKLKDLTPRFGIGEWFGKLLTQTDTAERRYYAIEVLKEKKLREKQPCPFQRRLQWPSIPSGQPRSALGGSVSSSKA